MDMDNMQLLRDCYDDYCHMKAIHEKAEKYYIGKTDAIINYTNISDRSNNKCSVNFIKKFVKEEVSYSLGNAVNYISKSGDNKILTAIDYHITSSYDEDYDIKAMKDMILHGEVYEISYVNANGEFKSKIVSPCNGYAYEDDLGNLIFFMHIFKKKFDKSGITYIDIYTNNCIYHYDESFAREIEPATPHIFGRVPIGIGRLSDYTIFDTIFNDIKGLQDSYETNLSDISNEISDCRNSYLKIIGAELSEDDAKKMKENGILQMSDNGGSIEWLIKNINDSFIQNTLNTLEDKMYQLTAHINHNVQLQSNLSGVCLRSRLISLEQKCILNQKAYTNLIKTRLQLFFIYMGIKYNEVYDYRDIKIKYTANIPQDDLQTAQMITQLGDKISLETALSLLSFITNPELEKEKVENEQKDIIEGSKLLNMVDNDGDNNEQEEEE